MSFPTARGSISEARRRRGLPSIATALSREASPRRRAHSQRRRTGSVRPIFEVLEELILLSGSISGTVWGDANGDGKLENGEGGLGSETVFLDLNHDGKNGPNVTTFSAPVSPAPLSPSEFGGVQATMDVEGLPSRILGVTLTLDMVNSGSSPVLVTLGSPTGLTVPDMPNIFTIQPGEHFVGTFDESSGNPVLNAAQPLAQGTYRPEQSFNDPSAHYLDSDPNGTWALELFGDTSGITVNSWSLNVTAPEPSVQTAADGSYTFSGLAPGTYQVMTQLAPGDVATSPASDAQTVIVGANTTATGVDFGIQPAPNVTGTAFVVQNPAASWGQPVTINYTLTNQGAGDASAFDVELHLSPTGVISPTGPLLTTLHIDGLAAHASTSGSLTVTLPSSPPAGFGAVSDAEAGFVIDPAHALANDDHAVGSNQGPGLDLAGIGALANTDVNPSSALDQNPSIAVDPSDPNHIVVASMDQSAPHSQAGYAGLSVSVSHDGGRTWTSSAIPLPAGFDGGGADPTVKFDAKGRLYLSFLAATYLGPMPGLTDPDANERVAGFQSNNGIFITSSTDGGATWGAAVPVVSHVYSGTDVDFEVRPNLAIDTFKTLPNGQANPLYGDLYVTWSRYYPNGAFPGVAKSVGGSDIMLAVSSDSGATWTTRMQTYNVNGSSVVSTAVKDTDPKFGWTNAGLAGFGFIGYSQVSIGPEGDIYISSYDGGDFAVFHSDDNGVTFRPPDRNDQLDVPFPGFNSEFSPDNFRVTPVRDIVADPTHPGRVYVAEEESVTNTTLGFPIDPGEIYFAVSNDYGQTWETIFQVGSETTNLASLPPGTDDRFLSVLNDDDGGNDLALVDPSQLSNEVITGQVLPAMAIDAQGNLTVIWYDTRRDPSFTNLAVFGTVSSNGGANFSPNFLVSDTTFNPNVASFTDGEGATNYYLGDHLGVAASDGYAYAVWTDTRSGTQQIEFQRFRTTTPPAPPLDRFGPNNTAGTAANLGPVAVPQEVPKLVVGPQGDEWFSVTSAASGALVVTPQVATAGATVNLALTDANGNVLATAAGGTQLVYQSKAGQSYLIHVSNPSGGDVDYSMVVGALTGDLGASVQGAQSGSLAAGGEDLYRLQTPVAGSLVVTIGGGGSSSFNVSILSADGQSVLASGSGSVTLPVTQGQVVLVQVTGASATVAGGYVFDYTNLDEFEAPGVQSLFLPTGSNPTAIATANLSGNGVDDIAVTNTTSSNSVSVLMGNGDGTFQSPRQYALGPGLSQGRLIAGTREIGVVDTNGDGAPDLVIPNFQSGDVSVLLNNGDGSFQPQRRFNANDTPNSLVTGNFDGNGAADIAVLQDSPQFGTAAKFSVLLGRGNGTFAPPVTYTTDFTSSAFPIRAGDFRGNGLDDLVVFSNSSPEGQIFLNNGDGTFRDGGTFSTTSSVANAEVVNFGNGHVGLVTTGTNSGDVYVIMGNGDGTFQAPVPYLAMAPGAHAGVGVAGLAVADFGSPPSASNPGAPWGPPDGIPDAIVTAAPRDGSGTAELIMLPGLADAHGNFTGFGAPIVLAKLTSAGNIAVGDFTGNGAKDLAVTELGGVLVLYGQPVTLTPDTAPATPRNLGNVPHLQTQPEAIVNGFEDAYFTYTTPTEAPGTNAGAEVIDFSAQFQDTGGAGLQMVVSDASTGRVLGTGARFRVVANQGEALTIHVFGQKAADGTLGTGVYSLDVDVLPQIASVEAVSALPGGPATSLVITLQGDRLDPGVAENPANYTVTWLGPDGVAGTADDQVIPVAALGGADPVIYNPGANLDVTSGLSYPTAVGQTITLLFTHPLPAGSYEIALSSALQAAAFTTGETSGLAGDASFGGHPIVSQEDGIIKNGASFVAANLVAPSGTPGSAASITSGTRFLTQLQSDLSALLDQLLLQSGDDPSITAQLNNQILARFAPAVTGGSSSPTFTVIWFDPVSIDLESPQGGVSYSAASNVAASSLGQTFVSVGGNVEVIVMANVSGSFNLDVGNVSDTARGGEVQLNGGAPSLVSFTDQLRGGEDSFNVTSNDGPGSGPGTTGGGSEPGPDPAPEGGGGGGGGGGAVVASTGSGISFVGSVLASALIGTVGPSTTSATPTVGTGPAAPAAASASSGPSGASSGQETNRGRSQSRANVGNRLLRDEIDDETMERWAGYLKETLQFVKNRMARMSNLMKAMGVRQSPAALFWQGLLQAINKINIQAAAAAARAGQPARVEADGGNAPTQPVGGDGAARVAPPAQVPGNANDVEAALWDQGVARLIDGLDPVDELAAESASGTYVYWAAVIAAIHAGDAAPRIRLRLRNRTAGSKRRGAARG